MVLENQSERLGIQTVSLFEVYSLLGFLKPNYEMHKMHMFVVFKINNTDYTVSYLWFMMVKWNVCPPPIQRIHAAYWKSKLFTRVDSNMHLLHCTNHKSFHLALRNFARQENTHFIPISNFSKLIIVSDDIVVCPAIRLHFHILVLYF